MRMNHRFSAALRAALAVILTGGCGGGAPAGADGAAGGAGGIVWVARQSIGPDTLLGIDPRSAEIVRRVGTEDLWSNLAIGNGALWSAGSARDIVVRIDPRSGQPDTLQVPEGSHPGAVLLAEGALWVANEGDGTVLRVDPDRREVVATIQVGESMNMDNPLRLAAGDGAVWVITLFGRHDLHRIDPAGNTVVARVDDVGDGVVAIAYGEGSVWVTSVHDGMVQRIDPVTLASVARIAVGGRPVSIAVGAGAVWVGRQQAGMVDRIDPQTNSVTASFPVGGEPGQIVVSHDAVWVLNHADQSLARIDPATNEVDAIVQLGGAPKALAAAS